MIIILYLVLAYMALSSLQSKLGWFYIGSFCDYFIGKIIWAFFIGWLAIPIWLIALLFGKLR